MDRSLESQQEHRQLFLTKVHFKPMTNLELSNALAHDAKLSFHSQRRENVGTQEIH